MAQQRENHHINVARVMWRRNSLKRKRIAAHEKRQWRGGEK